MSQTQMVVLDVETTMKCPIGNNKANPFWPLNERVLIGAYRLDGAYEPRVIETVHLAKPCGMPPGSLIVGHNIGFDLHHLLMEGVYTPDLLSKMAIWDTQLAEYILTGQQSRFATLDALSTKYGGVVKDTRVSDMFKAGMGADEVPKDMLSDYLKGDLSNTALIFWAQWKEAERLGLLPLIQSQMEARLATIEMSYNGLSIDLPFLEKEGDNLAKEVAALKHKLNVKAADVTGIPSIDISSPSQLSLVLFGGKHKSSALEEVGTYKNGKPKFRKVEKETPIPPWYTGLQDAGWLGKNGYFSTSDEVLSTIEERCVGSLLREFVATIKEWREKQKQLTTYYDGLRKLLMPDGCIHPNYNHALTVTGRLSSSEPNLQNITNGPIKKAFVSRWGKDGVVLEADYSQLEMVALAVLSHDEQMLSDIRDGVDMHNALYQEMYGKPLSKEERKKFKRCSFALVYGASANGIATQSGLPVEEARRFIDTFYARYKGVERWHQETLASVRGAREASPLKDSATGIPIGTASWISPVSNRIYTFKEYVNPEDKRRWAGLTSFSPTEVKNYPVQGTATGDIVPMMVGRLYRVLRNNPRLADKALLVNTVHDSVELDVHKSVLNETIEVVRAVLESAPAEIKHTFDYNFPLPLKVGVSYGPNWFEQTEVEFTSLREAA